MYKTLWTFVDLGFSTYLLSITLSGIIYANLTTRSGIVAVIARGIAEC